MLDVQIPVLAHKFGASKSRLIVAVNPSHAKKTAREESWNGGKEYKTAFRAVGILC